MSEHHGSRAVWSGGGDEDLKINLPARGKFLIMSFILLESVLKIQNQPEMNGDKRQLALTE
ncbi:MAG: hypothetical protein KKC71_10840 [Chloroflexi bacterium]|nr:hypothetical protein [Chloroflexota bacterium]